MVQNQFFENRQGPSQDTLHLLSAGRGGKEGQGNGELEQH